MSETPKKEVGRGVRPKYVDEHFPRWMKWGGWMAPDPKMSFFDDTNDDGPYQGKLRFAPLDIPKLHDRIREDAKDANRLLVMTHRDQLEVDVVSALSSYGPTRDDVR